MMRPNTTSSHTVHSLTDKTMATTLFTDWPTRRAVTLFIHWPTRLRQPHCSLNGRQDYGRYTVHSLAIATVFTVDKPVAVK